MQSAKNCARVSFPFGSAWYPEHWSSDRWDTDLRMMADAGMNVLRLGEFAWSRMEPQEGRFSFAWFDAAIERAAAHGMVCLIATPTAGPPAWLTQKHPEVLRIERDGRVCQHGARQHFNPAHPTYLELCRRIAGVLAQRYGKHPSVIGWQIDNEIAHLSFDPETRRQFQDFCRRRFGTLDRLNERWTTAYWSQEYSAWEQIPLDDRAQNACLLASLHDFITFVWKRYFDNQADAIRAHASPSQFVTHNFSYEFSKQDPHDLATSMEFPGVDTYQFTGHLDPARMGLYLAATRGLKRGPFWVMETQPGFVNYMPVNTALDPGETRRMIWHQVGHGADGVLFWQWRSALGGQEQMHGTLVGPDGRPRPVLREIAQCGAELRRASESLRGTVCRPRVAMAWSYRDRATIQSCPFHHQYDTWQHWCDHYGALRRFGLDVEAIRLDMGLADYALVVAPQIVVLDPSLQKLCMEYVQAGGHLLLGPRTGFFDNDGALLESRRPGALLADLLGAHSEEHYSLDQPVPVVGEIGKGRASIWGEWLMADQPDVEVVMRYGAGHAWLEGKAALLSRRIGEGRISYLGAWLDGDGLSVVAEWACRAAGVELPWGRLPDGLEVSSRVGSSHCVYVICNHGTETRQLLLRSPGQCVLTGRPTAPGLLVPPNDVAVVRTPLL